MAQEAKVAINIASEFTGKKAFKQADAAVSSLGKTLKRALIGVSMAAFAKSAISAFVVADKTAQSFANTMNNIGLKEATADVLAMTDAMEMQFGVAAARLIPAYQKFAVITRNTADSQKLLNLALDVSAGTSNSLETVTNAFTRALNGNNTSLGKLGSNLTKADLATGSLNDNLKKLSDNYAGAATTASETLSNKITRVGLAFQKAKEYIGGGLIDAVVIATGSANIEELQRSIINFGKGAAEVFVVVGNLIAKNIELIKQLGIVLFSVWTSTKVYAGVAAFLKIGEGLIKFYRLLRNVSIGAAIAQMTAINPIAGVVGGVALVAGIFAANKALDSFENSINSANKLKLKLPKFGKLGDPAYDVKANDKITKAKAAQLKLDKEAKALKKSSLALESASKVFDIDLIQNAAALRGKLTEDETLKLKLQQAILLKNSEVASKLSQELLTAQIDAMILSNTDPFGRWTDGAANALAAMILLREEIAKLSKPILTYGEQLLAQDYAAAIIDATDSSYAAAQAEIAAALAGLSNLPQSGMSLANYQDAFARPNAASGYNNQTQLVVSIDPMAAAAGVNVASINNTANGNSNSYSTIQSFKGGTGL
jgi:hypothetical protein